MPSFLLVSMLLAANPTITSPTVVVGQREGTVHELRNQLTGESLIGPPADLAGRVFAEGTHQYRVEPHGPAAWTRFEVDEQAVRVTHSARADGRLRGLRWGLSLPPDAVLLVPGQSGLRLDRDSPTRQLELDYPLGWECGFLIIQTPRGGFLIHAVDRLEHFKTLLIDRTDERCAVSFETQAVAPWATATQAGPLSWRIVAFEGDWTVGAAIYRRWMTEALGPTPLADQQPDWVDEIQTMIIADPTPELCAALAERFDPRRVMIYSPGWRSDSYDRDYPDYTPGDGVAEQIAAARAMGFRVMLHVNYFGCTPENPAYEALRPYHVRGPRDGAPQYWDWTRTTPPIKFAYINPAARAWRELFVAKMVEVVARTGADALHLDQTLCIYNDANGLIDGLNMMQGNLELHRELRRRLPRVALGGEGLNEVTAIGEAFAQRHLYGLNHADGTWSDRLIAQAHPISSAVLRPFTAMVGYLGYSSPRNADLYLAWEAGYERFGIIPTLAHIAPADLRSDDLGLELAIRRARQFGDRQPAPDFDTPAGAASFRYRTADGAAWEQRPEPTGSALTNERGEVLFRRLRGAAEVRLPGRVSGMVAWDAERVFGLNPNVAAFWDATPRDDTEPHVVACEPEVPLSGRLGGEGLSLVALGDAWSGRSPFELARRARVGVIDGAGQLTWRDGENLQHASGAIVQPESQFIFVHPPWREGPVAAAGGAIHGRGHTLCELTLSLPAAPGLVFRAELGLREGVDPEQADGITGRLTATAGDQRLTSEAHAGVGDDTPISLDLRPFAGREVTLLLETTPGPAGNPSFDWAQWRRPRFETMGRTPVRLRLAAAEAPRLVLGPDGPVPVAAAGDGLQDLVGAAPGRLYLFDRAPLEPAADADLTDAPWIALVVDDLGRARPAFGYSLPSRVEVAIAGRGLPAISAHPPVNGRQELVLPVTLPARPVSLRAAYGIRENNQSQGVGFRVRVGEEEIFAQDVRPPTGPWREVDVDLSRWARQTVVITLVADSLGPYDFDWAVWGRPHFEPR